MIAAAVAAIAATVASSAAIIASNPSDNPNTAVTVSPDKCEVNHSYLCVLCEMGCYKDRKQKKGVI